MALTDTAEYWNDVKNHFAKFKSVFTHFKGLKCGHYHVQESENLGDVDCCACIHLLSDEQRLIRISVQKKRDKNYKKRQRRKVSKAIKRYIKRHLDVPIYYFCYT